MPFEPDVLLFIMKIIFIDIILGGDNAIVIALACRKLPEKQRNKAILIGTGLAVLVRISLTAIIVSLLSIPYLLFIGGIFLIMIAFRLITSKEEKHHITAGPSLFGAVRTIVIADVVMGLDNMLAIAGAARGHIGYIAIGLIISVPIIIWGSKLILTAMEKLPILIYGGGAVLVYTASEMILSEPKLEHVVALLPHAAHLLPVILILLVIFCGWMFNRKSTGFTTGR
ncbi:TerC family protein [Sporolactobacillus sp. Y61]|uniref:TerC family protein n=1 Tax=Sporolactobacillus sp. Y61 TaxID=3160863 RepID=A0AAU8ICB5_9BACL